MKSKFTWVKIFTVAMAVIWAGSVNAQPVFSDDFSSNIFSTGWTVFQTDTATSPNWAQETGYGNYGDGAATSYSWSNNNIYRADNYLVSPQIDMSNVTLGKVNLTYYWFNRDYGGQFVDGHDLFIMFGRPDSIGEIIDSAVRLHKEIGDGAGTWNKVEIDFRDYKGEDSIFLIFHHNAYDQHVLALDDISIDEPALYDIALSSIDVETYGFGVLGYYPYEQTPKFPYAITVENVGVESFRGFEVDAELNLFQGDFNLSNTAFMRPGDSITSRGFVELLGPEADQQYTMDVTVAIDSNDKIQTNNSLSEQYVISTSSDWYTRIDTAYYNVMEYLPDFDLYSGLLGFTRFTADRYQNIQSFLGGPNGEQVNKVMFGGSFSFNTKTSITQVEAMVAPKITGQNTWIEIYDYDKALNTIGDIIEPVLVSDTIQIPAGFDDGNIHMLIYDFVDQGGLAIENPGKYIVCVVEQGNSEFESIGLLGFRDFFTNWSANNSGLHAINYTSTTGVPTTTPFNNSLLYVIGSTGESIRTTWPISLRVANATGIEENFDMSHAIEVYPNPTEGVAHITISGDFNPTSMRITDVAGRVMANENVKGQKIVNINAEQYDKGIYFVEFTDGENKAVKKLIVK